MWYENISNDNIEKIKDTHNHGESRMVIYHGTLLWNIEARNGNDLWPIM